MTNATNKLRKLRCYLAGRMNHETGEGRQWRVDLTPFLEKLGLEVLDPYFLEPHQLRGLKPGRKPEGINHWTELRDSKNPDHIKRFLTYMRRIIKFDINIVKNIADMVIVKWDEGCKTGAGTHAEITIAWDLGKPIYCVEESRMPSWARACCEEVFSSFDELKEFLQDELGEETDDKAKDAGPGTTPQNGKSS